MKTRANLRPTKLSLIQFQIKLTNILFITVHIIPVPLKTYTTIKMSKTKLLKLSSSESG